MTSVSKLTILTEMVEGGLITDKEFWEIINDYFYENAFNLDCEIE